MSSDTADADRWHHHLTQLLSEPAATIALGGVSKCGALSMQTSAPRRADDLLHLARALIEQALDTGADEDVCEAALAALPDMLADDD